MYQSNTVRSLTALCVVEEPPKVLLGYNAILKTFDTDQDADLWRDGIWKRVTRYICLSRSQGRPEHVIQSILIINDKELPPEGYSLIQQTVDSCQKPFKKKQLCFKLTHYTTNVESIVDLIILSKIKGSPPDNYERIGDINGMHICVKKVSAITRLSTPSLSYGVMPGVNSPPPPTTAIYPSLQNSMNGLNISRTNHTNGNGMGENYSSNVPQNADNDFNTFNSHQNQNSRYSTLSSFSGLDGVPFVLRDDLKSGALSPQSGLGRKPNFNLKTHGELDREYAYDFRTEQDVIASNGEA